MKPLSTVPAREEDLMLTATSRTLIELLRCRTEAQPNQDSYTLLSDGKREIARWAIVIQKIPWVNQHRLFHHLEETKL